MNRDKPRAGTSRAAFPGASRAATLAPYVVLNN